MPCLSHSRFYNPNSIGWLQIIKPLRRSYHSISPGPRLSVWTFRDKILFTVNGCQHFAHPPGWSTTPYRLSATAYSLYSQLPFILEAVPPSATWGRE
jgi:hypothetical protein